MAGTYSVLNLHHRRSTLFFNASSAAAYILHWSEGNCLLKFQLLLSFFLSAHLFSRFWIVAFFFFRASINKINIVDDALRLLINTFSPSTLHMLLIKALDYHCSHCKVRMSSTWIRASSLNLSSRQKEQEGLTRLACVRQNCQHLDRKYVLSLGLTFKTDVYTSCYNRSCRDSCGSNVEKAGFFLSQYTEFIDNNVKQTNLEPRLNLFGLIENCALLKPAFSKLTVNYSQRSH